MINETDLKKLRRNARIQAAIIGIAGVACMLFQSAVWSVIGLALIVLAALFAIKGPEYGEMFLIRQRSKLEEFKEDKRGIVWVWVVALLTWAIMAIAYFSLSMVVYMVLDQAEAFIPWSTAPPWADSYLQTINLTRNVCGWFLIIMTVGIIGWALLSSARHVGDTGPVAY